MNLEAGSISEHKELKVITGPMKDMEGMQERDLKHGTLLFFSNAQQ